MGKATQTIRSLTAYDLIRDLILSGEVLPGTRLVLSDLEQRLGVGRGPLREALMRLDRSGLVQNIPYKGVVVLPHASPKEMEIIYQARVVVEVALAVEAMHKATKRDIVVLEALLAKMKNMPSDAPFGFHEDRIFHSALYTIAQMPQLQLVVDNMLDHVEAFLTFHSFEQADKQLFAEQHGIIINTLRNKDEATLRQTLESNILLGLRLIHTEMARLRPRSRTGRQP